jgi:superfamily II DNA or RNA helicase
MKKPGTRTYGSATLKDGRWEIRADPQVLLRFKRLCEGVAKHAVDVVYLSNTPEHCRDLAWFCARYPLVVEPLAALKRGAKKHRDHIARVEDLLAGHTPPPSFQMTKTPRAYQAVAVALALQTRQLLIGDDLGLGKTVMGIATFTEKTLLPALVVCPPHLISQWIEEVHACMPALTVAELTGTKAEAIPQVNGRGVDVLVTSFHRIAGWAAVLKEYCHSVIFDEVADLRRTDSQKYNAAMTIARAMRCRLGLSATPIYNYGDELFNVLEVLGPGRLGTKDEFVREWCSQVGDRHMVRDSKAFGAFLREQGYYLQRTRSEVGRELPPLIRVTQSVGSDRKAIEAEGEAIRHLASIILRQTTATRQELFVAGGELDARLRQATGIAKAPYVASFVQMLVETTGEPILLAGWHRAVYDIWMSVFKRVGISAALYTGSETPAQKQEVRRQFIAGEIQVMVISLRSGTGLDGLQQRCATVVHGELDWSPAVHDQLNGRPHRDGQQRPVTAYYLVSDDGSDPVIAETLGVKRSQLDGIRNPEHDLLQPVAIDQMKSIRKLAEAWLQRTSSSSSADPAA